VRHQCKLFTGVKALAGFYSALLGWEVTHESDDWVTISDGGLILGFQRVADYRPPAWPDPERPQQCHLDLAVDDLDQAEAEAVALGAVKHEHQPGKGYRVFLDPAGHPFCLCT